MQTSYVDAAAFGSVAVPTIDPVRARITRQVQYQFLDDSYREDTCQDQVERLSYADTGQFLESRESCKFRNLHSGIQN
jgi:hypothetical protein